MSFNHYAKMKRILEDVPAGWYIKQIDKPTKAQSFAGDWVHFDHYYRIYSKEGEPIKFCKFQQLDRLAKILQVEIKDLPM